MTRTKCGFRVERMTDEERQEFRRKCRTGYRLPHANEERQEKRQLMREEGMSSRQFIKLRKKLRREAKAEIRRRRGINEP